MARAGMAIGRVIPGYLVVLAPPALLAAAALSDSPLLVIGIILLVFPLGRVVFGAITSGHGRDPESASSSLLDSIPMIYAAAVATAVTVFLASFQSSDIAGIDAVGWTFSLWLVFVFGTCVAHVLLHHHAARPRAIGHALAGALGYPVLGYEHNRHHRFAGNTAAAEWPRAGESLWSFAIRRLSKILPESLGPHGLAIRGHGTSPTVRGLRTACVSTMAAWLAFAYLLGWTGAAIYGSVVLLVGFSIQLVTFMQHWGLGDDLIDDARAEQWGWEDDCLFQSWITMGLSVHLAHHRETRRAYYGLDLQPDSPRMPAGYILLMFAAFLPSVWRRVMSPALEYWKEHPRSPPSAGRSLTCAVVYRRA